VSELDKRLMEQSGRLFDQFAKLLRQVQPTHVGLGVLGALAPFAVDAVMTEMSHQKALLEQGQAVLDAYLAKQPSSTMQTLSDALTGQLESKSLTRLGNMAVAISTLPFVAGGGVFLAQQFVNMKSELDRLKQENSLLIRGVSPVEASGKPRGASRASPEEIVAVQQQRRSTLGERFDKGLAALEQSQDAGNSFKFRGPSH